MIQVKKLSKFYTQAGIRLSILNDLDFVAHEKEKVAILGQSGSGKTTLLSLLAGLERPSSGEIYFFQTPLHQLSDQELTTYRARHLGIVFQQYHLIEHLTAYENVLLPLEILGELKRDPKGSKARVDELLEQVGLGAHINQQSRKSHFPHQLSGGENQRVALARALVTHPKIILADEPSGSLDKKTGEKVMDLLFHLVEKHASTLILVTHNEELAKRCDRVLVLDDGKFLQEG